MAIVPFSISVFRGAKFPQGKRVQTTWGQLVNGMMKHRARATKDGQGWCPFTFGGDKRGKDQLETSHTLVLDIDSTTTPDWRALEGLEYVAHTTYTGKWRVVLLLSAPVDGPTYNALARKVAAGLDAEGWKDHRIDEGWFQPSRFYFTPSHPPGTEGTAVRGRGVALQVTPPVPAASVPQTEKPVVERVSFPEAYGLDLEHLRSRARTPEVVQFLGMTLALKPGSRDNAITRLAGFMASAPKKPTPWEHWTSLVDATLRQSDLPEGESTWRGAWREKFERFYASRLRDGELARAVAEGVKSAPADDWRAKLTLKERRDGSTEVDAKDPNNITVILRNDPVFQSIRLNSCTFVIETSKECPLHGYPAEHMGTMLQHWLAESEYRLKVSRQEATARLFAFANERAWNPITHFIDTLPEWDGVSRVNDFLRRVVGADGDPDYIAAVSRCFFISAIARGLSPGCQVDTMLILQGSPGTHKSTFVHELAPGLSTSQDIDPSRDGLMALAKNWFVEFAEMVTSDGRNDRIRGFLTRRVDEFRAPYAREVVPRPRQCIFIGTTNDTLPIKDEIGMRRNWPITVTRKIDIATMRAERMQVWAEARARYLAGEKWWFSEEEEAFISSEVSIYVQKDVIQEAVERAIVMIPPPKRRREYKFIDILDMLGMEATKVGQAERTRIGTAMQVMGFTKRRYVDEDGRKKLAYVTPPGLMTASAQATGTQAPRPNVQAASA